jgi:hypothetical protein
VSRTLDGAVAVITTEGVLLSRVVGGKVRESGDREAAPEVQGRQRPRVA